MTSVSIVTYNTPFIKVEKTIHDILRVKNVILFIVDNSASNSLINQLPHSVQLHYIFNNKNIGFGAAHNIAIKKALQFGSKYHLVLNPDVFFDFKILEEMINFMKLNLDVGLMMPEVLYPNGEIQYLPKLLPSPLQLLKRKGPVSLELFEKWNQWYIMSVIPRNMNYETPIISGCFSLFRTEIFNKIGLYDERFFMYFEDFDISRRVHKYYRTIYYSKVSVYHEYEKGAQKKIRLFIIFINSAIKYFNKWGWLFDKERKIINQKTIQLIKTKIK